MIKNKWQYVPIAILIILVISEILWYVPYTSQKRSSFSILSTTLDSEGNFFMKYYFYVNLPLDVTIIVTPMVEKPQYPLPIYVFYDKNYTTVGTSWVHVHMLWAHLKSELYLRGYSAEVKLITTEKLEHLMSLKRPAIVIIATGAFPSDIFSWETNLVKPWIDAGGILIWFGWVPGYYVVEKGQTEEQILPKMPQHLYEEGAKRLGLEWYFEIMPIEKHPTVAENDTYLSRILDTTFNRIQQAPLCAMVLQNGLILGKIGGEQGRLRSSISLIPMQKGKIIVFGFFLMNSLVLNGPELAARDIAQILCSGVLYTNQALTPEYRGYQLTHGETIIDTIQTHLTPEAIGLVIYVYSHRESSSLLFYREFLPVNK